MKGHVRPRGPGRWAIILDERDPETGRRRRRWHSFAGSKREAETERARLITELTTGNLISPQRETVASFLPRWIEHMQGQVAPRSIERYAELCRKNIAPLLRGAVAGEIAAGTHLPGLRQGAHQRPPGRAGRAIRAHRASHAPGAAAGASAGRAMADAGPQPGRSGEAAQGRARADAHPRHRPDRDADRGGAGNRHVRADLARRAVRDAPG